MTYADFVALLKSVSEAAGATSFWTGVKTARGINYNEPFPQVELFILPSGLIGETVVQYSVGMAFCGKDAHENGGPDTIAIQSAMDELTQRFIRLLREEEEVEIVDRAPTPAVLRVPTVRTGPGVGTGLFIDFTVNVAALPC